MFGVHEKTPEKFHLSTFKPFMEAPECDQPSTNDAPQLKTQNSKPLFQCPKPKTQNSKPKTAFQCPKLLSSAPSRFKLKKYSENPVDTV